jgi:hypothetical protein
MGAAAGVPQSAEHKAKRSKAMKEYWSSRRAKAHREALIASNVARAKKPEPVPETMTWADVYRPYTQSMSPMDQISAAVRYSQRYGGSGGRFL